MKNKLEKPPIVEVACEFRFGDVFEDFTVFGSMHQKLISDFPKKKLKSQIESVFEKTNGKVEPKYIERNIQQFLSDDEKSIIQITQNSLIVNQLKPYKTWEDFVPKIETAYKQFINIAGLKEVKRIGLRYINKINFKEKNVNLEEFFQIKPTINVELGDLLHSFFVGVEIPKNEEKDMIKITFTRTNPDENYHIAYILDFDFFTVDLSSLNVDNALAWVKEAHDNVENAFFLCITDKLRETFK